MARRHVVATIAVSSIALLALLWSALSGEDPGNLSGGGNVPNVPTVPPDPTAAAVTARVLRTRAPVPEIVAIDRISGVPIATATLTQLSARPADDTVLESAVASADEAGVLRHGSLSTSADVWLVRASGYVPICVEGQVESRFEVRLERAGVITFRVIDSVGRTVRDAWIVLATDPASRSLLARVQPPPEGIGHPLSKRPMWVAITDATGAARMSELPVGRYMLNVLHRELIPVQGVGANGPIDVAVGEGGVTVTMQVPYAVVFHCPAKSPARNVHWSVDLGSLDRSPQVITRLGMIHQVLQARFPEDLVYVHRPLRPEMGEVAVRCRVACVDGTFWTAEWPLRPVDTIDAPVFLEQDVSPTREIVVELRDAGGLAFRDVPFALVAQGSKRRVEAVTGESFLAPCDTYAIRPRILSRAIWGAFSDRVVEVTPNGPTTFTLTTAEPLVEVLVRPKLPSEEVLSPLEIYVANQDGQGPAIANWIPASGPVRVLLDAKRLEVRVRSMAYEDVDIPERDVTSGKPVEIDIPLRVKPK